MTAKSWWLPDAGEWVAYRDEPARRYDRENREYVDVPGETRRVYLWDQNTGTSSTSARDCVRFDTKAEAYGAAKDRWPERMRGFRIGAERIRKT